MHDILDLCLTSRKKTHVMYRANLSFEQSDHLSGYGTVSYSSAKGSSQDVLTDDKLTVPKRVTNPLAELGVHT